MVVVAMGVVVRVLHGSLRGGFGDMEAVVEVVEVVENAGVGMLLVVNIDCRCYWPCFVQCYGDGHRYCGRGGAGKICRPPMGISPLLHGISQELSHGDHRNMIGQVEEEGLHMEVWKDVL